MEHGSVLANAIQKLALANSEMLSAAASQLNLKLQEGFELFPEPEFRSEGPSNAPEITCSVLFRGHRLIQTASSKKTALHRVKFLALALLKAEGSAAVPASVASSDEKNVQENAKDLLGSVFHTEHVAVAKNARHVVFVDLDQARVISLREIWELLDSTQTLEFCHIVCYARNIVWQGRAEIWRRNENDFLQRTHSQFEIRSVPVDWKTETEKCLRIFLDIEDFISECLSSRGSTTPDLHVIGPIVSSEAQKFERTWPLYTQRMFATSSKRVGKFCIH